MWKSECDLCYCVNDFSFEQQIHIPLVRVLINGSLSTVTSYSAPERWSGSTREMISSRAEVYVYLWGEPLSRVKLVGK